MLISIIPIFYIRILLCSTKTLPFRSERIPTSVQEWRSSDSPQMFLWEPFWWLRWVGLSPHRDDAMSSVCPTTECCFHEIRKNAISQSVRFLYLILVSFKHFSGTIAKSGTPRANLADWDDRDRGTLNCDALGRVPILTHRMIQDIRKRCRVCLLLCHTLTFERRKRLPCRETEVFVPVIACPGKTFQFTKSCDGPQLTVTFSASKFVYRFLPHSPLSSAGID
jgi:hypothetical protein